MDELPALLQRLDAIETACREERWEDAESLMSEHAQAVKAVPIATWSPDALQQLLDRQQVLATLMRDSRDAAAKELSQMGASKRGAQAYRK